MTDLEESLMLGKGKKQAKEYKRRFQEVQAKVRILKNKNNELQMQCDRDLDRDIRQAIRQQGRFLEKEIGEIKKSLGQLSNDFTDPAAKNKIKDIWRLAGIQIERNRRIMQQFVNRASSSPSFMRSKMKGGSNYSSKYSSQYSNGEIIQYKEGSLIKNQQDIQDDIVLQEKIAAEKRAILKELQEKNNKIHQIYNDMAQMVGGQQHDMIQQMNNNMSDAKQNVIQANVELDEAIVEQKKAKGKYCCIVTLIVILIFAGIGLVYLFLLR